MVMRLCGLIHFREHFIHKLSEANDLLVKEATELILYAAISLISHLYIDKLRFLKQDLHKIKLEP